MRLAFALYKYFPFGGMQRDFRAIVLATQALGHDIRIYCVDWEGEQIPACDLRLVPARGASNVKRNERFTAWMSDDLAADPVDGVIGFNKMPGLDVYFAADNCYLEKAREERGWFYRLGGRFRHFARYEKAVFAADSTTDILLISERQREGFARYHATPQERMHMLPPGISKDRRAGGDAATRRARCRDGLHIARDAHVLLFVGSGFKTKGLDRAIDALAAVTRDNPDRELILLVAGKDKETSYRHRAKRLGVSQQVRFLGGRDDIPELLLAADALIHPARNEAAGIALLEALVAGLPVLVTEVCGYAVHIANADAGIVLPGPFSPSDLERAVRQSLDGDFRARASANALAYADSEDLYSMHRMAAELIVKSIERRRGTSL